MDFNSLKEQVSNLTLYDLKAGVRKVQNGKQNEIETLALMLIAKSSSRYELYRNGGESKKFALISSLSAKLGWQVREATNNEPWGASSTVMQEIANATHN